MEKIVYVRPTKEEWDQMSEEMRQRMVLLEAVDDIRNNTKSTRDIAVIFLVLAILGMLSVVVF